MDYEGVSTPMGPNGRLFKPIYHDNIVYNGWIGFRFTLVHKDIMIIMQGCIGDSEQGLWIGLID